LIMSCIQGHAIGTVFQFTHLPNLSRLAVDYHLPSDLMKLESIRPMLAVTDIDATILFYRKMLGFECTSRLKSWANLHKDNVELMICLPNVHEPFQKPTLTGSLYFNTADVDALWNELKDKVSVAYPIENFFYGMREFAIRDNNGYLLQFGQEISDPAQIPPPEMD
jgi:uncharacterized glyoxalase superfamily protein PhnB